MCDADKPMTDEEKEQRRQALDELVAEAQRQGFYDGPNPNATPSPLAGYKPRS